VPVVASDLGAPKEIITDGVTGYILNPNSPQKIADTVIQLLENDEEREKMGDNALQYVQQHYNDSDYARAVENVYADIYAKVAD